MVIFQLFLIFHNIYIINAKTDHHTKFGQNILGILYVRVRCFAEFIIDAMFSLKPLVIRIAWMARTKSVKIRSLTSAPLRYWRMSNSECSPFMPIMPGSEREIWRFLNFTIHMLALFLNWKLGWRQQSNIGLSDLGGRGRATPLSSWSSIELESRFARSSDGRGRWTEDEDEDGTWNRKSFKVGSGGGLGGLNKVSPPLSPLSGRESRQKGRMGTNLRCLSACFSLETRASSNFCSSVY